MTRTGNRHHREETMHPIHRGLTLAIGTVAVASVVMFAPAANAATPASDTSAEQEFILKDVHVYNLAETSLKETQALAPASAVPSGCYSYYDAYGDVYDHQDTPPSLVESDAVFGNGNFVYEDTTHGKSTGISPTSTLRFHNQGSYGAISVTMDHWESQNPVGFYSINGPGSTNIPPGGSIYWDFSVNKHYMGTWVWPTWHIHWKYNGTNPAKWGTQDFLMSTCWK